MKSVSEIFSQQFSDIRLQNLLAIFTHTQGLSGIQCPAHLTFMPLLAHRFGVRYVVGGRVALTQAFAKVFEELGGKFFYKTAVSKIEIQDKAVRALRFENGWERKYSAIVLSDEVFAQVDKLIPAKERPSWSQKRIEKLQFSASAIVLQLSLSKCLDLEFQTVLFSKDPQKNDLEVYTDSVIPTDPTIFISHPSCLDDSLAPKGKSTLSLMVLVPNLQSPIAWESEIENFKQRIYSLVFERMGVDLRPLIEHEEVLTPYDLEQKFSLKFGALFGLAQSLEQSLQMRPHHQMDDFKNLFVVGRSTYPGAGLGFELISAKIAAGLCKSEVSKRRGSEFQMPRLLSHFFRTSKPKKNVIEIVSENFNT